MEFLLSVKNGQYNLEKIEGNIKRRTNNQGLISRVVGSIDIPVIRATFLGKDVRMYFGDDKYLTLKNYTNYKELELYSNIMSCINENTRVIKNINNINKNKLKLITALTIASLTITAVVNIGKKDSRSYNQSINNQSVETVLPTDIPSITLEPENEIIMSTPTPEPTITPEPVITKMPEIDKVQTFEERLSESVLIRSSNPNVEQHSEYFCKKVLECSKGNIWKYMCQYGEQFGVDPYLVLAICYTETNLEHEKTLPGGSSYNGSAVGIGQHENPNGKNSVTAFNYKTNQYETEIISMKNACDLEMNIKMTTMLLQNKLKKYKNIKAAIQSYNYGDKAMKIILNQHGSYRHLSVDEVLNDFDDTGWLKNVEYFHKNPKKFLPTWEYDTYGDPNYIQKVTGYYIGTESTNIIDGTKVTFDLVSLEKEYESKMR